MHLRYSATSFIFSHVLAALLYFSIDWVTDRWQSYILACWNIVVFKETIFFFQLLHQNHSFRRCLIWLHSDVRLQVLYSLNWRRTWCYAFVRVVFTQYFYIKTASTRLNRCCRPNARQLLLNSWIINFRQKAFAWTVT